MYVNEAWPTRDKIIPWKLYAMLSARVPEVAALDRLILAQGVAAGIGISMSSEGKSIMKELTREAFPETAGA